MFGMGWSEIFIITVVALVVIGPKQLPEVARGLARVLRQVQRMANEVRNSIDLEELSEPRRSSPSSHASIDHLNDDEHDDDDDDAIWGGDADEWREAKPQPPAADKAKPATPSAAAPSESQTPSKPEATSAAPASETDAKSSPT
ncbi:Sec-independent protein translocase protein TatB [Magnetofaba australis]|uniref:Sec-independent protein translocase protein TatB n=1 Tax=Magnetofaba australis IT-1 TaxID=1434232 RepID=A0A1Y2K448_9PROT|nr:Sec-independent protein translocase protein TatB [Magnetofaba australis]OSM02416.1 putative twin-arginine translocation protein TatB [Magnetofaba australis IT-1]